MTMYGEVERLRLTTAEPAGSADDAATANAATTPRRQRRRRSGVPIAMPPSTDDWVRPRSRRPHRVDVGHGPTGRAGDLIPMSYQVRPGWPDRVRRVLSERIRRAERRALR